MTLRRSSVVMVLVLAATLAVACTEDDMVPDRLMNGAATAAPPLDLERVEGPAVLTAVRVVEAGNVLPGTPSFDCLRADRRPGSSARGKLAERFGVESETVTFRDSSGLHVCDNSPGRRENDRRWCGGATAVTFGARFDPRLSILCETAGGDHMGFAWVQPDRNARFVSVRHPDYVEVYEVAAGVPVRVATAHEVEYERTRAIFDLLEHDADGRLLREYRLEAFVAG